VFVVFNKTPYAIIARQSRGIHALSDLEGKTLGVAEGDLAIRLWPRWRGKTESSSQASSRARSVRPCAADIVGRSGRRDNRSFHISAVNLGDRGVPSDDLAVLRYADYGCEAYGFAVIVNPVLAATRPEAVKASCAR
jgi:NitT/TauT family transport system substrate-binding protein